MKAGGNSIRVVEHTWTSGFIFSVLTTSAYANQGTPTDLYNFSSSSADVGRISGNALTPTGKMVRTAGPLYWGEKELYTRKTLSGSRDERDWPFITSFT